MILTDSSIWIDHFRKPDVHLSRLFAHAQVLMHPYVIGELALGNFKDREIALRLLREQPTASLAGHDEVMDLIKAMCLYGRGIGYVDAHQIASIFLMPGSSLWTRDKRLAAAAIFCGCRVHEP